MQTKKQIHRETQFFHNLESPFQMQNITNPRKRQSDINISGKTKKQTIISCEKPQLNTNRSRIKNNFKLQTHHSEVQ